MLHALRPLHLMMRAHIGELRSWLLLFYIWAAQWMAGGFIKWYGEWKLPGWFQSGTALAAALLSFFILLTTGLRAEPSGTESPSPRLGRIASIWVTVPFALAVGSLMLLEYVRAVDPFFMDLFRCLLLAFFFSCLGVLLGLELLMLGIWLFGVSMVTCVWYLGFAPMVLQFMGGLSLLACGLILKRWCAPKVAPQQTQTSHPQQ